MWSKGRPARDLGLKERHGGEVPGFSFSLIHPRLEAGKPATQKKQWIQEKAPTKIVFSSIGPGKSQPLKTENFHPRTTPPEKKL